MHAGVSAQFSERLAQGRRSLWVWCEPPVARAAPGRRDLFLSVAFDSPSGQTDSLWEQTCQGGASLRLEGPVMVGGCWFTDR